MAVLRPVLDLADKFAMGRIPQPKGSHISQEAYFEDGVSIEITVRDNKASAVLYDADGKVLTNLMAQDHFSGDWKVNYGLNTYKLSLVQLS